MEDSFFIMKNDVLCFEFFEIFLKIAVKNLIYRVKNMI